ncbi:Hsp20/alpha crystallin family protein [Schinkia sp. CFF1]
MDMDKLLQWMELAKKYQASNFWSDIFDQAPFDEFMRNNDTAEAEPGEPPLGNNLTRGGKFPPTDIYVTDEEVLVIANLAGYMKEEIELSVSGTKLLIKGSNNRVLPGEPVQQERFHGTFERIIQLPEPTYPDQIRAKFNNGLLLVTYKRQFKNEQYVPID